MKKTIHFTMQGKGGVGKSFITSLLFQYLQEAYPKEKLSGIDTDPNNSTFYAIKELKALFLDLLDEEKRLDERKFDNLMEVFYSKPDHTYIVDNGATSFLPLYSYIKENEIFEMLSEKFNIIVHIPIVGGQAQEDTISAMDQLINTFKNNCTFVVWINEYFGKIKDENGKTFEEMDAYKLNKKYINGIIYLSEMNEKTYGKDLEQMTKSKKTFKEVDELKEFSLMTKQRLRIFKKQVFGNLSILNLNGEDQ